MKFFAKIALVLFMMTAGWFGLQINRQSSVAQGQTGKTNQVPTLFVHGFGGSYASEKGMIAGLSQYAGFQEVLYYLIKRDGRLAVKGKWRPNVKHSLIAVVFESGNPEDASALGKILKQLKARYGVRQFNAVGHSAGSLAWTYWATQANKTGMPKLKRFAAVGGPFNAIPGMGANSGKTVTKNSKGQLQKMSKQYADFYHNRQFFPKTAKVLNLFGNLGDGSDGRVPIGSAKSLRYLVADRVREYTEHEIGYRAQHSQLHQRNKVVNGHLYKFLSQK